MQPPVAGPRAIPSRPRHPARRPPDGKRAVATSAPKGTRPSHPCPEMETFHPTAAAIQPSAPREPGARPLRPLRRRRNAAEDP